MSHPSPCAPADPPISQKHLGSQGLIVFLALLSAFVPLSTDLYLPALPGMSRYFKVPVYQTNLTLILFFVFFSLSTLVWGPLSDKHGRRPILLTGLGIYTLASGLCALSLSVYHLMLFRVLQAIGAGAATAVSTAIVKDAYHDRKRETILALVQSMVMIAPAVAPVIGALLLKFTSWRGVFVVQALLGLVVVGGAAAYEETLHVRRHGNFAQTVGRLVVVLRNPGFTSLLVVFSMLSISSMAFIASSSYIYQETFGLSSQTYSYYFAFNAAGMLAGPLVYLKVSRRFRRFSIINVCFGVMIASGLLVCTLGPWRPWMFALALLPATLVSSGTRPPSTFLMLDQQKNDAGSASSLMSAVAMIMGSVGMTIVSLDLGNLVKVVGTLNIVFGLVCGGLWLLITQMPFLSRARQA